MCVFRLSLPGPVVYRSTNSKSILFPISSFVVGHPFRFSGSHHISMFICRYMCSIVNEVNYLKCRIHIRQFLINLSQTIIFLFVLPFFFLSVCFSFRFVGSQYIQTFKWNCSRGCILRHNTKNYTIQ